MEDIKVGNYVRFKDGKIRKIVGKDVDGHLVIDLCIYGGRWLTFNEEEKIIACSPNIIDLIEVGDFVNGHIVEDLDDLGYITLDNDEIKYDDIKNIVTKEMFNSVKYEV